MALKTATEAPESGGQDFPELKDYIGRIVIFEPMKEVVGDTKFKKDSHRIECVAWWYDEKKKSVEEIGQVSVFWNAVRAQLSEALTTGDQVAGRLVQNGRRYELDPITDDVLAAIAEKFF